MQRRQVVERDADVDVVREVPPRVVRHEGEPGEARLVHGVGGLAPICRTLHSPVLGDCPQAVDYPPHRHPRRQPEKQIQLGTTDRRERRQQHKLREQDAQRDRARRTRPQRSYQGLAGSSIRSQRARRGSACGGTTRRVIGIAGVQRLVGFVGAHLVLVVRHVALAVHLERNESWVIEQPLPGEIVDRSRSRTAVDERPRARGSRAVRTIVPSAGTPLSRRPGCQARSRRR